MTNNNKIHCVIIIASTDYLTHTGGTEKFTHELKTNYNKMGKKIIHIFPLKKVNYYFKNIHLKREYFAISFDEKFIGVFPEHNISNVFYTIQQKYNVSYDGVILNHFWGWNLNILVDFVLDLQLPIKMIIHDYNAICRFLLASDSQGENCCEKIEKPSLKKCSNCKYRDKAIKEFENNSHFLKVIEKRVESVLFPSDDILEKWSNVLDFFGKKLDVRPHYTYTRSKIRRKRKEIAKIAYLGSLLPHKGFSEFLKMQDMLSSNKNIKWYYFGTERNCILISDFKNINTVVVDYNLNISMAQALKNNDIDIVFLWSKCQESYSYTYFEAVSASCYVITNMISGNIKKETEKSQNGKVFESIDDVYKFLTDEDLMWREITSNETSIPNNLKVNTDMDKLQFQDKNFILRGRKVYPVTVLSLLYIFKMRRSV